MKYVYNAERDRLKCAVYNPCFFKAQFADLENKTEEPRYMMLYAKANIKRHLQTVAEKYATATEEVKSIEMISRAAYQSWLGDGVSENGILITSSMPIPMNYVTDYLMAQDAPHGKEHNANNRYGDLSGKRALLSDPNFLQELEQSYERSLPEHDIVREEPDPEIYKDIYETPGR